MAGKKPFSTHTRAPGGFPRLGNVVIKDGWAFGRLTDDSYDPFASYHAWREKRDALAPPHLTFANLEESDEAAKEFLGAYGPLTGTKADVDWNEAELDLGWYHSVKEAKERFDDPEGYFSRNHPRIVHDPSKPPSDLRTVRVNLSEFWAEQEEFLLLELLWEKMRNKRTADEIRRVFLMATRPRSRVSYGGELTPQLLGDLQVVFRVHSPPSRGSRPYAEVLQEILSKKISRCGADDLRRRVNQLLSRRLNDQLGHVQPLLLSQVGNAAPTTHWTWQTDNLLAALYMMLFLDITYERRVVRCGGCGILFADAKENVFFCSPRCETRARVRRWWRKNGKGYRRRRKQGSSGRPKTSKKKKRVRTPRSP